MKEAPVTEAKYRTSVLALFIALSINFCAPGQGADAQSPSLTGDSAVSVQKPAEPQSDPERKMPPCLTALAKANRLEDLSLKSGKLKDSVAETLKLGSKAGEDLNWIIENGSPCGRMYAALILKRLDTAAGTQALDALNSGMGNINLEYVGAAERCHYSVSDILIDQASAHPLIQLIPR